VHAPAYRLGADLMRINLPQRETHDTFIGSFVDQMSPSERAELLGSTAIFGDDERLEGFYRVWTVKEAYTKALGMGLGFDFSRLSLEPVVPDASQKTVLFADGKPVEGWELKAFEMEVKGEAYLGAVARFIGGSGSAEVMDVVEDGWITRFKAEDFVQRSIDTLGSG
jgi:4'-phosphopantetheinyl transferase